MCYAKGGWKIEGTFSSANRFYNLWAFQLVIGLVSFERLTFSKKILQFDMWHVRSQEKLLLQNSWENKDAFFGALVVVCHRDFQTAVRETLLLSRNFEVSSKWLLRLQLRRSFHRWLTPLHRWQHLCRSERQQVDFGRLLWGSVRNIMARMT